MKTSGAVILSTYSRSELFEKSLESIYQASGHEKYKKIIVIQNGFPNSIDILRPFLDENTSVIMIDGKRRSPLQNICFNYLLALEIAFDKFQCDWVLELEDDTVIAEDTFVLIEDVMSSHYFDPKFRGINLGTTNQNIKFQNSYSLLRSSFHASQGLMTRKSWKKVNSRSMRRKYGKFPMDWSLESYWKTGFVATPNISRCMNFGWQNGTHVAADPNQKIFVELEASWSMQQNQKRFHLYNVPHSWNGNSRLYLTAENWKYFCSYFLSYFTQNSFYLDSYRKVRNIKRFFLNRPKV